MQLFFFKIWDRQERKDCYCCNFFQAFVHVKNLTPIRSISFSIILALKASFLIWRLVQKLSEHTDKIILKVFTCCSQTIYCSQFKVFVFIDACYHWKPLTEPLQPLPQLPYPWPNCRALCVTTTSTTSAHPLLLGGDQGDRVTLQKSRDNRCEQDKKPELSGS